MRLEGQAGGALQHRLRARVLEHLSALGLGLGGTGSETLVSRAPEGKDALRYVHAEARRFILRQHQEWIWRAWPSLSPYFAQGRQIVPARIRPVLVEVAEPWQRDLFRLARLTWSLPYSKGYGRRLRFLILDEGNRGPEGNALLIGILALQSPPLSFPARDRCFRYPRGRKVEMVNQTMDIQTLGAVPPYSALLGGKLIAFAAASNEVRLAYRRKYASRRTELQGRTLAPHLVALTTTSAFGRSSLYNRLRYHDGPIAVSLGYTEGYGSFHLEVLYPLFRAFLEAQAVSTRGGYGVGPRIKWQTCARALDRLRLPRSLLRHGLRREAFLFPLISNLKDYMEGRAAEPVYRDLPFEDLAAYWRERWLLPRAGRVNGWHAWEPEHLLSLLIVDEGGSRG